MHYELCIVKTMNIITRLLIAAASACSGALVGLFFLKRLKTRAQYFAAVNDFISHVSSEIKFRKNPLKQIVSDFLATNQTPFSKNLTEFNLANSPNELVLSKGVLKKTELEQVRLFLLSLGTLDSETQTLDLELQKEKFASIYEKKAKSKTQYSSMFVKLGFLAGLALGIIIL